MLDLHSSSETTPSPAGDWSTGLNAAQTAAAGTTEGPLLVVAGAGTGKTRTIEHRVLHLLQRGVRPEHILLLTFTRRAAREMLARVAAREPAAARVDGGTYHAFANRTLRRHAAMLGLSKSFTILDPDDAATAVGRCMGRLAGEASSGRFPRKETVRDVISKAANTRLSVRQVLEADFPHYLHHAPQLERVRGGFARYKITAGLLDYDDLLTHLIVLLRQPHVAQQLADRHRYVLVDEYQDTNWLQAEITRLLAARHGNVMVVGDDAQAIYGFRGSRRENFLGFANGFEGWPVKVVKLEENYRSTQPILDLANQLLASMRRRFDKRLRAVADRAGGHRPRLYRFEDAADEAEHVAAAILRARDEGTPFGQQAVLYRGASLATELQMSLAARRIPFRVFGGLRLSEMAHVKDVLAVLRVLTNPRDGLSWARVLERHEGVGPRVADKIAVAAVAAGGDLDAALLAALTAAATRAPAKRAVRWFRGLLAELRAVPDASVAERFASVLRHFRPLLELNYDDHHRRWDELQSLAQTAGRYARVEDLLADLSLDPPRNARDAAAADQDDERPVTLSTIHSAKGLEWRDVYVIGLADGRLPSSRALANADEVEEELRLLYVAVTRARRRLTLSTHVENFGAYEKLSRFLDRPDVLSLVDQPPLEPPRTSPETMASTSAPIGAPLTAEQVLAQLQSLDKVPNAREGVAPSDSSHSSRAPRGGEDDDCDAVCAHPAGASSADDVTGEEEEEFGAGYPY